MECRVADGAVTIRQICHMDIVHKMLAIYCCIAIWKWVINDNKLVDRGCKALTLSWRVLCFDCLTDVLSLAERRRNIFVMVGVWVNKFIVLFLNSISALQILQMASPVSNSPILSAWEAKMLSHYTFQSTVRNNTPAQRLTFHYFTNTCLACHNAGSDIPRFQFWFTQYVQYINLCNISVHSTTCIAGVLRCSILQYYYTLIYCYSSSGCKPKLRGCVA